MSPLTLLLKPVAKATIRAVRVEQELFLYDDGQTGETVHCLNGGAALIWHLCDGTHTVDQIAREIAETFNESLEQVQLDVVAIVTQFQALGIVTMQVSE